MTEHGAHPGVGDLLLPVANFLLFAGGLAFVLRGPLREYFRERAAKIRAALAAGAEARAEADALRQRIEEDLADLPRIRAEIRAELKDTAERQRARTLEAAQRSADRIRSEAEALAAQEQAAARRALREEVVTGAIEEATALVRGALGDDDHRRFVREFTEAARLQ